MATVKVVKIKVDTSGATKPLKDLGSVINEQKTITIEFEKELAELETQLKNTSKSNLPAQRALKKRIEGLRDAIKDQRLAVKSLNLEQSKVKGIKSRQVASDKLNKTYFEGNEVMHDVNRLTSEYALKLKAVKNLFIASWRSAVQFIKGLSGIKKALLATGIGALVIALGLVVAHWEAISDFIKGTNKSLERQIKLNERNTTVLDEQLKTNKAIAKLAESEGKSVKGIVDDRKKILQTSITQAGFSIAALATQLELEKSKARELSTWQKIRLASSGIFGGSVDLGISEKEQTRIDEIQKKIDELKQKSIQARTELNNIDKDREEEREKETDTAFKAFLKRQEAIEKRIKQEEQERERLAKKREKENEDLQKWLEEQEEIKSNAEDVRIAKAWAAAKERAKAEQWVLDAQMAIRDANLSNLANGLGLISSLFGENKALQVASLIGENAVGIARTIIQTQASNAAVTAEGAALAIPTGGASVAAAASLVAANNISAGISIAASVAAAAKGISALGGGGSVEGGSSGGGSAPSAPSFNLVQGTGTNQIAEGLQGGDSPIKAFVVSSDVSTSQEADRKIVEGASLG